MDDERCMAPGIGYETVAGVFAIISGLAAVCCCSEVRIMDDERGIGPNWSAPGAFCDSTISCCACVRYHDDERCMTPTGTVIDPPCAGAPTCCIRRSIESERVKFMPDVRTIEFERGSWAGPVKNGTAGTPIGPCTGRAAGGGAAATGAAACILGSRGSGCFCCMGSARKPFGKHRACREFKSAALISPAAREEWMAAAPRALD